MIAEFDDGCRSEHTVLVDDKFTVCEGIDITLDEQQIGTALHG